MTGRSRYCSRSQFRQRKLFLAAAIGRFQAAIEPVGVPCDLRAQGALEAEKPADQAAHTSPDSPTRAPGDRRRRDASPKRPVRSAENVCQGLRPNKGVCPSIEHGARLAAHEHADDLRLELSAIAIPPVVGRAQGATATVPSARCGRRRRYPSRKGSSVSRQVSVPSKSNSATHGFAADCGCDLFVN